MMSNWKRMLSEMRRVKIYSYDAYGIMVLHGIKYIDPEVEDMCAWTVPKL